MTSIYDILSLREAEDTPSAPAENKDEGGLDDDFSIDTSLDDGGSPEDGNNSETTDIGGEPSEGGDDGESSSDGNNEPVEGGEGMEDEAEEIPANTDIFASLTAEEQEVKIKELKRLFVSLYTSCDDMLTRIDNLEINEDNLDSLSRISNSLYDMKIYISDYLASVFNTKSYIENDIAFNKFLIVIKSITDIMEDIAKKTEREEKNKENN